MRLTSELKSQKPGHSDALAKFNETVEPVILEYEKVVSALNKQLDELRAELVSSTCHFNSDANRETNISDLYEDQNKQLLDVQSQQTSNENYVNELRSRLGKLAERSTSSEVSPLAGPTRSGVDV